MSGAQGHRRITSPDEARSLIAVERAEALGAAGVPALVAMLGASGWSTRRRVIAALAALGAPAVAPLCSVIRELRGDETANAAAMDALAASPANASAELFELAKAPDPAIVTDAARVLGRRRDRSALPLLTELAMADDDNVAVAAIEALGTIGGRGAVETLIALVRTGNFFRTFPAIDVLGRSGDPRAVAPLADLLDDARYALEAARALGRTANRSAAGPLAAKLGQVSPTMARVVAVAIDGFARGYRERYGREDLIEQAVANAAPPGAARSLVEAVAGADDAEQEAIARVLGFLRDPGSVGALEKLVEGSPAVARAVAQSFQRLGPIAHDRLRDMLRNGDSARRTIVLGLATKSTDLADEIAACLDDPDGAVRALAAEALARVGAADHAADLFPLLDDPNPRVVHAVSAAIQALGSDVTERLTLEAARSPESRVRREAMQIVRTFGWPSALPAVVAALDDADVRLRDAAIMALPFIDDPQARALLLARARSEVARDRATGMRALGQGDASAECTSTLLAATRDADPWVRYYAAQALGRLGVDAAVSDLVRLLDDVAGQVRVAAVEALSNLRAEGAFEALEHASRSPDSDIRRAAVLGLGLTQRPEAVVLLLGALRSTDAATRLVATSALGKLDAPGVIEALGGAAGDADEAVRQTAIAILAESAGEEATLALVSLLRDATEASRVRLALSAASPGRVSGIVRAMSTADEEIATVLASSLARMRTSDAEEALVRVLTTGSIAARKGAAIALGSSPRPAAIAALETAAASDADAEVRRVAAAAARE